MMTDSQLIHEIAHGNNSAFTELYETYRKEFLGYIRMSFKGDEDTIFDLYQDSCVALYNNIRTNRLSAFNLTVKLKTYLFTIGRNKLVDLYRRSDFKGRKHLYIHIKSILHHIYDSMKRCKSKHIFPV